MNVLSFMPYIWITIVVFSVIIEAVSGKFVAVCFLPTAIIALVMSLIGCPVYAVAAVFAVMTALLIVLRLTVFAKYLRHPSKDDIDTDALIGEKAIVTESVDNNAGTGKVKISGLLWRTVSYDDKMVYAVGEVVELIDYKYDSDRFVCK